MSFRIIKEFHDKLFFFLRYFEGYTPIIVTSDPDAAQQILIKDFHKFHSRKVNHFG